MRQRHKDKGTVLLKTRGRFYCLDTRSHLGTYIFGHLFIAKQHTHSIILNAYVALFVYIAFDKETCYTKNKERKNLNKVAKRTIEPSPCLLGKVMGFEDFILKAAAGAVQIASGTSSWSYVSSYFDDPRDQIAIQKGIDLFKETHD